MDVVPTRIDAAAEDAGEFASRVADCTVERDTREDFEAWVRSDAFCCTYEDSKALINLRDAVQLDG